MGNAQYVKGGYTPLEAFRTSKVAGVSFGRRPAALRKLTQYTSEQINVQLVRENDNHHDSTAIRLVSVSEDTTSAMFSSRTSTGK